MRILAGVFMLMIFAALVVSTAAAQELEWDQTYGTLSNEMAYSVDQTTDGGYIMAGFTHAYGAGGTVSLIKTDSKGNEKWNRMFGGADWDIIYVVYQTTDGGYIMAGTTKSFGAGDADLWLIKTDSSGNEMWSRTFGGANYDGGYDVKQTTDGGYILLGDTSSYGSGEYDLWLIKMNSSGDKTWEKLFGGISWDFARGVWQTTDGGYVLVGETYSYGAGQYDIWLIKTDSAGNMMWNRTFGGAAWDQAQDVQQTADGGYIVAGNTDSFGPGEYDFWLIKTDSAGNMMWDKTFGGTAWDEVQGVQQTADGGYIMAGTTESYGAGETDVWVIKTDINGNSIWEQTFGGTSEEMGRSVQQTTDGGYIAAGWTSSYGAGGRDMWLIKIKDSGLATITLQAPADGAVLTSPPTFFWIPDGGVNNVFAVDLSYDPAFSWYWSTYEHMHRPISVESWTMPQPIWDFIPSRSHVYWRVRGADLQYHPPAIVTSDEVWWFKRY